MRFYNCRYELLALASLAFAWPERNMCMGSTEKIDQRYAPEDARGSRADEVAVVGMKTTRCSGSCHSHPRWPNEEPIPGSFRTKRCGPPGIGTNPFPFHFWMITVTFNSQ